MTVLFADRRWELERGVGKRLRAPGLRVPLLRAVFPALWAVKRKDGVGQGVFISKSQAWHIDSVPLGVSCRIHRFCRHQLVSLSPSLDRAGGQERGGLRGGCRAFPRFPWVAAQGRAEVGACGGQSSLPRRTGRPGRGVLSKPCFCSWVKSGAF